MAKRFIDTGMFDDPWFMDLTPELKCFWIYAITKCDHAGILTLNKKLAKIQIGVDNIDTLLLKMGDRFLLVDVNKFFIPKFIEFQYGVLDPKNRVHKSVLDILNKYENKGHISPLLGAKDKDKDKDIFNKAFLKKEILEINVDTTESKEHQINLLFDRFVQEVKDGGHDSTIDGLYRNLRLKEGSLTTMVHKFNQHLIDNNNLHKNPLEFRKHFVSWLNVLDSKGLLDDYKKHKKVGI